MGLTPEGLVAKNVEDTARSGGGPDALRPAGLELLALVSGILADLEAALNEH